MVLDKELLVQMPASPGNRDRCRAGLVRGDMPAHGMGEHFSGSGRRRYVHGPFRALLVAEVDFL